jgi:uncharacterized protein
MKHELKVLRESFSVHRLNFNSEIPHDVFTCEFFSITKTAEELSIIVPDNVAINDSKKEDDWKCIKVVGPLDFSMIGLLADISKLLAEAKISIFALSTYDTDYILVKKNNLKKSIITLKNNGYQVDE